MSVSVEVEQANRLRWDMQRRRYYEVYYITFNHLKSRTGFWIRYTITSPAEGVGQPYGEVWFGYFNYRENQRNFGVRRKVDVDEIRGHAEPFHLRMGDCELSNGRVVGGLAGMGHDAFWDFNFAPSAAAHLHMPKSFYVGNLSPTVMLAPNLNMHLYGHIRVDGVKYDLRGDPGTQTHYWGRKKSDSWAWAHCASFVEEPEAVFEGFAVRMAPLSLPLLTAGFISIIYKGKAYRFTELHDALRVRGGYEPGLWHFRAASGNTLFQGEISCRFGDLISAEYMDPDGRRIFCNNTETGSAVIQIFKRKHPLHRWKHAETISSVAGAHVEFAARKPDARVTVGFEDIE